MKLCKIILACAVIPTMAGCSTPKVALDHANNGVALTAGLQRELSAHEARQSAIDTLRKRAIATEILLAKGFAGDNAVSDQLFSLSGQTDKLTAHRQLREVVDLRSKVTNEALADDKQVNDVLESLMKPLPPQQGKIAATQKALAELGTELKFSERLKLVTAFLKEVRDEIEKNKQAADATTPATGK